MIGAWRGPERTRRVGMPPLRRSRLPNIGEQSGSRREASPV